MGPIASKPNADLILAFIGRSITKFVSLFISRDVDYFMLMSGILKRKI